MSKTISDAHLILLVCFFTTLSFFSVDLVTPSLPSIMQSLHTNAATIQGIVLFYILGLGLSQFIYGPLGDRFGRRIVVITGVSICLLGNGLAIFAYSVESLTIARFICAFGSGAGMIIARVVFRDCFSGHQLLKANSYFSMSVNISPAIAPFCGGLIQEYLGWRWVFVFLSLWALIILISLARYLPETLPKTKHIAIDLRSMLRIYRNTLANRVFVYSTLLSGTCLAASLSYLLMSPFLYQLVLGLSPAQNGILYLANACGFLFGAILVNRFGKYYYPSQLIYYGLITCFIASASMLLFGLKHILTIWVLFLPAGLNSVGFGLIMPSSGMIALSSIETGTGMASALLGGIRLLIVAGCAIFVVLLHEHNQIPMASLMVGFVTLGFVLYGLMPKPQ